MSQPDYTGPLVHSLGGADISWIVGWFVTAGVYILLVRLVPDRDGPLAGEEPLDGVADRVSGKTRRSGAVDFDYVVVGAGTAGCVLAARLSEQPDVRVLVLEMGSAARTRAMTVPNAWPENLGSAADWGEYTTPQASTGPVRYPRGRALGGTGAINAMAHVRGHRAVYDSWARSGAAGWGFTDLLPYFRRSEQADGHDPALRGTSGPVRVGPAVHRIRWHARSCRPWPRPVTPVTDDLSGAQQEGVGWADLAISGGERASSADAYLRPNLDRPNLTVATGCLVTRLLIDRGQCTGVRFIRDGEAAEARATGEVILAAGAIGSPQLLMLSGIGPADQLRGLGVEVAADLPGVGANLQDHPVVYTSHAATAPLPASRYNNGEAYAALRSDLAGRGRTCTCSPSCCPSRRPGASRPPRASSWPPPWWPPTAGARSRWPPPTSGRRRASTPVFLRR